jgi:hypothetical protein
MAKLNEETIEIKISELLKDSDQASPILEAEILEQIITVLEELVGPKRMVEVNIK